MVMSKSGKTFLTPMSIRITGAVVGSVGFFLVAYNITVLGVAYNITVLGTTLIGIGSLLIAVGEN